MTSRAHDRLRVVVAGGGVAALETLLALRSLAGQRVKLTLISVVSTFGTEVLHGCRRRAWVIA
jgi:NADH dehydrogenase FAD-containing subunit